MDGLCAGAMPLLIGSTRNSFVSSHVLAKISSCNSISTVRVNLIDREVIESQKKSNGRERESERER